MSNESLSGGINHNELVVRLCKHLAGKDEALAAKLIDMALKQLSSVEHYDSSSTARDEPYYVHEIRNAINAKSRLNGEQFDLLYSTISNSSIITQRSSILCFLYNIFKQDQEAPCFSLNTKLEKFSSNQQKPCLGAHSRNMSHVTLSNNSVKHIFERDDRRVNNSLSTGINKLNSHTMISSVGVWSKNETTSTSTRTTYSPAVTEKELLQDVIFSLQGIQGKYIRKEAGSCGFILDSKTVKQLSPTQRALLERLLGMSFLHRTLKQFCEDNQKQNGSICQAFVATLNNELSDYYKSVALLQASMNSDSMEQCELTLRRALFVVQEHREKFEWLAHIAEECSDKKGGAMISAIHSFLQHGSSCAQEISERVLKAVCKPLYIMLSRWLLDGEIIDPCNEFFIQSKNNIAAERLWHDKYNVRKSMVPSFINMEHAKRILATGKSINFLRQICKDSGQLPGREALQKLFKTTTAEALFTPEQSIDFHSTLKCVYKETSLRVLDLLKNKFKLYEHLQSLRRYLLLGQGDFIRHLMELLMPELNRPAEMIYKHTLSAILESAIRVTNAQYEDEDTLRRLNVSFMTFSVGDMGWDVFSLVYNVDGPIGTIFIPTMPIYQSLFGALWKAKRTEYVLANMRRQQLSMAKLFRKIKEMKPVMHIIHVLTSKMIHFIHQTQYYFLFEVLECSWADMQHKVNRAECLDDIIVAHRDFLTSVMRGVLLDEKSRVLFSHLISIYNFVVKLESHQESLYVAATEEFEAYMEYRRKTESTKGFEINVEEEHAAKLRIATFRQFLNTTKIKVKTTVQTYDVIVTKFLELLKSSSNMKLQLLSVRLSFNSFYKIA